MSKTSMKETLLKKIEKKEIVVGVVGLGYVGLPLAGIATNVHYKPLPMHTAYKKLGFRIDDYPNAYETYHNEITLPLHTCLTDEDVDCVLENFKNILASL